MATRAELRAEQEARFTIEFHEAGAQRYAHFGVHQDGRSWPEQSVELHNQAETATARAAAEAIRDQLVARAVAAAVRREPVRVRRDGGGLRGEGIAIGYTATWLGETFSVELLVDGTGLATLAESAVRNKGGRARLGPLTARARKAR